MPWHTSGNALAPPGRTPRWRLVERSSAPPVHHRHMAGWNPDASLFFVAAVGPDSAAGAKRGYTVLESCPGSADRNGATTRHAPVGCTRASSTADHGRSL